jgi:hypothetical protein
VLAVLVIGTVTTLSLGFRAELWKLVTFTTYAPQPLLVSVQVCNLLVLAISAFIIHQLLLRLQLELAGSSA